MSIRWILLSLLVTCGSLWSADPEPTPDEESKKPYERVLVLSGGSLRTAAFLGAIEGCIEKGYPPDLIISTCGGSLAAAIVNHSSDPKTWRRYLESEEFYEYMKSVRVNPHFTSPKPLLNGLLALKTNQVFGAFSDRNTVVIPDLFSKYVVELPLTEGLPALNSPFSESSIPILMVAGKLNYDPSQAGKKTKDKALFTESYFTDPLTANHLKGQPSGPGRSFPDGYISQSTETFTGIPLYDAARASMSEPSLVQQKSILISGKTVFFTAGSINGYPIDLAKKLGRHVVATAAGPQGDIENTVYQSAFGISLNKRYAQTQKIPIDHWIDFTDWSSMEREGMFGPKLDVSGFRFVDDFPKTHEDFLKILRAQYEWGKAEALKALATKKGSRGHLRKDLLTTVGKSKATTADVPHAKRANTEDLTSH